VDFLHEIVEKRRQRVEVAKGLVSFEQIFAKAGKTRVRAKPHALLNALLSGKGVNVIAEFKRRSPSRGVIRANADPATIAQCYQKGGAMAISVLTEEDYFGGSLDDLRTVKGTVDLPVLRKDFIIDEYQLYEAAAVEADAVLLIVAALQDTTLLKLRQLAEDELEMDALVEVHDKTEMQRAAACGATLIGVNNRDLRTFEVSLETSLRLSGVAHPDAVLISESGLHDASDLQQLREVGYRGFLVGESLMRAEKPNEELRRLTKYTETREGAAAGDVKTKKEHQAQSPESKI
jgi:indole-3-glycerol phosphate synthase